MLTRRDVLARAIAAGTLLGGRRAWARAPQPSTPINFQVPAHACDCHAIIIGDPAKFPFFSGRTFTPDTALPEEMAALHKALHIERVLLITTSVYGTDNSVTLYGMRARGKNARGVALIDDKTTDSALDEMGRAGMCGIRLLLPMVGPQDSEMIRQRFRATAARAQKRNWHIQMYINIAAIPAIKDMILQSPVPIVLDHFAGVEGPLGRHPAFPEVVQLIRSGKIYIKFSGEDLEPAIAGDYVKLIAANPDRILWGSDWPHMPRFTGAVQGRPTDVSPHTPTDDGRLFNLFPKAVPNAETRKRILVDNPARIYGFEV